MYIMQRSNIPGHFTSSSSGGPTIRTTTLWNVHREGWKRGQLLEVPCSIHSLIKTMKLRLVAEKPDLFEECNKLKQYG